jgi:WhiB family redox-sensing transcriptional regulator
MRLDLLAAFMRARPGDPELPSLNDLLARPSWWDDAACRSEDPALFFPEGGDDSRPAKAICGTCPVLEQCRADAHSFGPSLVGIFAGQSGARPAPGGALRAAEPG